MPALSTLTALCHRQLQAGDPKALQRQPSLGRAFTRVALDTMETMGTIDTIKNTGWKATARLQNLRALQGALGQGQAAQGRDPAAKNLVAWCDAVMQAEVREGKGPSELADDGDVVDVSDSSNLRRTILTCRCRLHGRADLDGLSTADSGEQLAAVFVDHDRRPHCERQALIGQIQHLLVRKTSLAFPKMFFDVML